MKFKAFYDETVGLAVIAMCQTFGCKNRRDIVRRLTAMCDFCKDCTFGDAITTFRYYEQNGLVKFGDGYVVVYHNFD